MIKRGNLALEDGKWDEANNFFEQVLNENVEEYRAYIGKLCAEMKVSNEQDLVTSQRDFTTSDNYRKACRSSYYSMHEEILLAYCGCYGVDSSDVELLLEYGYTCDEIEDMLTDHSLLREALRDVKYMCSEELYESCYGGVF